MPPVLRHMRAALQTVCSGVGGDGRMAERWKVPGGASVSPVQAMLRGMAVGEMKSSCSASRTREAVLGQPPGVGAVVARSAG